MEIRTRLTLQFIAVVAFILAISFVLIYLSSATYRESSFFDRLQNKAISAAELLIKVNQVDSRLLRLIDSTERDHLYMESISVYDDKDNLIYTSNDSINDLKDLFIGPDLMTQLRTQKLVKYSHGEFEILGTLYQNRHLTYVVFASAIDKFGKNKLINLSHSLLALFLGILFVVAIAGWIYSGRALAPISQVVSEAENISPDNLSSRLEISENQDEIGRLVTTFNKLLDRLDQAMKLQRLFVAGASHELRNPLTAITSQLEVSLLKDRSVQEYKTTLQSILEDIRNLNHLSLQLMELARLNHGYQTIAMQPLRLDDTLWQACHQLFQKKADYVIERSVKSLPEDERQLYVAGNESLLITAFTNLVENACKFSPDHKAIVVFEFAGQALEISVADRGPGIELSDADLIYEPFFRSKNSTGAGGHGIGLALVEKIVKLHKGEIFMTSSPTGTVFKLVFKI